MQKFGTHHDISPAVAPADQCEQRAPSSTHGISSAPRTAPIHAFAVCLCIPGGTDRRHGTAARRAACPTTVSSCYRPTDRRTHHSRCPIASNECAERQRPNPGRAMYTGARMDTPAPCAVKRMRLRSSQRLRVPRVRQSLRLLARCASSMSLRGGATDGKLRVNDHDTADSPGASPDDAVTLVHAIAAILRLSPWPIAHARDRRAHTLVQR